MPAAELARVRLVLAGHFDARLAEVHALAAELETRARALGLERQISLARSPSDAERRALLARAACVVYTPLAEHFGIVPLEAMAAARPVIAVNRGGPTETIVNGETGWLAAPTPTAFADALARVLGDAEGARRMGLEELLVGGAVRVRMIAVGDDVRGVVRHVGAAAVDVEPDHQRLVVLRMEQHQRAELTALGILGEERLPVAADLLARPPHHRLELALHDVAAGQDRHLGVRDHVARLALVEDLDGFALVGGREELAGDL